MLLLHKHRFLKQREGSRPIKNSAAMTRLHHPKNDKEIQAVPNNHHQKLRILHDMAHDLYAHVIIRDFTKTQGSLIPTKIRKLSRVACVQHLLC